MNDNDRQENIVMNKSLVSNTIWNLIKTFSSIVFPLITFPYVSRVLLPENMGKYEFSNTYVSYFTLVASLGITTYAIRECSIIREDKKEVEKIASQIYSINICSMLISYLCLIISVVVFGELEPYRAIIIILSSSIYFTIIGADWINSAYEDFKYKTIRTLLVQAISLLALFLFVKKPSDYIKYAIITAFSVGGANLLNVLYRRRFCTIRFIPSIRDMNWKKHFPPIVLLFVMLLVQTIFCNSDITMLGIMKSDYEVGLYSTSAKIYNLMNQIMASILWVMLPRLTAFFAEHNYDEINKLLRKSTQFMVGIGLPCIVGGIFLSEEIVTIIGGKEYIGASIYLKILMVGLFFSLIGGSIIGNMILLPSKREKYFLQACIVAAVVNVLLNLAFIGKYGALAAAISTLISHIVIFVMLLPRVEKEIRIGSFKDIFLGPLVGIVAIAGVCWGVKQIGASLWITFGVAILLSILSYMIVLILFRYELFMDLLKSFIKKCFGRKRQI